MSSFYENRFEVYNWKKIELLLHSIPKGLFQVTVHPKFDNRIDTEVTQKNISFAFLMESSCRSYILNGNIFWVAFFCVIIVILYGLGTNLLKLE